MQLVVIIQTWENCRIRCTPIVGTVRMNKIVLVARKVYIFAIFRPPSDPIKNVGQRFVKKTSARVCI